MTCESALELLLDAEPSEFSASETTPLGRHLRGCAKCRRVAAQLQDDTRRLALAMTAAPVRRPLPSRRSLRLSLAPVLAVAALAFAVALRSRPDDTPVVLEPRRYEPAVPPAPAVHSASPNVAGAPAGAGVSRPAAPRAFARAIPVAPVRLVSSTESVPPLSVETSGVTVTPPSGTRATVMHTSNPKLVVVWLY